MAAQNPAPTFVIGVGEAGIGGVTAFERLVREEGVEEFYRFLAVDSSERDLPARSLIERIHLEAPTEWFEEDKNIYPYLTPDIEISEVGAERQRPVGRYKLDNRELPTYSQYFDQIYNRIEEHFDQYKEGLRSAGGGRSLNILLIHSLGGGTGSGTFPLISGILHRSGKNLEQDKNIDVYIGAVGVLPELDIDISERTPEGENVYYPNAYASLRDLSKMIETRFGDPIAIPLMSRYLSIRDPEDGTDVAENAMEMNSLEIDTPPYSLPGYFLVGVDEGKMQGEVADRPETYVQEVDNTIAEALYALSRYAGSLDEDAFSDSNSITGSFDEAEVGIPYDQLTKYCGLQDEHRNIEELIQIFQSPNAYIDLSEKGGSLVSDIQSDLDNRIGRGAYIVDVQLERLQETFDGIASDNGLRTVPLAIDIFRERIDEAGKVIETERSDQLEELYDYWQVDDTQFGNANNVDQMAASLSNFFEYKRQEYESDLEEETPGGLVWEFLYQLPPWIIETEREETEKWYQRCLKAQEDFDDIEGQYHSLVKMEDFVGNHQERIRKQLVEEETGAELGDVFDSAVELVDGLRERLKVVESEIESWERKLADPNWGFTGRLGYLTIRNINEIDTQTLDRLDSIAAFINEGFVSDDELHDALVTQVEDSAAWANPVMNFNPAGMKDSSQMELRGEERELWTLFSERNEGKLAEINLEGLSQEIGASGIFYSSPEGDGKLTHIEDDYTIKFITFVSKGPVEGMTQYQRLESAAKSGALDRILGPGGDFRLSHAYPEWYDREIKNAFQIESSCEVQRPPELAVDHIHWTEVDEQELSKYIRTNGLAVYLWRGTSWPQYEPPGEAEYFDGWGERLTQLGITFRDVQQTMPPANETQKWVDGHEDWDEILEIVKRNLADTQRIDIEWKVDEEAV